MTKSYKPEWFFLQLPNELVNCENINEYLVLKIEVQCNPSSQILQSWALKESNAVK